MEIGAFAPQCSIFHNIFKKNSSFQKRPKALVWSKGLRYAILLLSVLLNFVLSDAQTYHICTVAHSYHLI